MKSKKQKILYIVDRLDYGGAGKVASDLIEYFSALFEVKVITLKKIGHQGIRLRKNNIAIAEIEKNESKELLDLIHSWQPNIIHSHSFNSNYFLLENIYALSNFKVILQIHGMNQTELDKFANIDVSRYRQIHKLIFVSDNKKESLTNVVPTLAKKAIVIKNGIIEQVLLKNKQLGKVFLEHYGISNRIIIGSVGELVKRKGHHILIKAIKELIDRKEDISCIIAGEGTYLKELKDLASKLKISNRIQFVGYIEDMHFFYNAIDYFVFPSFREGLPLAILEAMSFGNVIVSTDVGGIPEIIIEEKTGFLIKPKNIDEIVNKYFAIKDNIPLKEKVSKNAMKYVSKNHNITDKLNQYKLLYDEKL